MVKPLIDKKIQLAVFKKYKDQLFQANGKAKSCKESIYEILIKELEGMSAKSIQTSINRNAEFISKVR